ncbi:MAG: baseplate J/gp47 family protein [Desulfobacterales bacterium]|nr:baseplate J/gp47 family protein [Desulfobacterales bacterium]
MAYNRPTLKELIEQNTSDMNSRLEGTAGRTRRSVLGILARVNAGAQHALYGFGEWILKQIFPDTADPENLERRASVWGIKYNPATYSQGTAVFSGENGSVIPAGTQLLSADGLEFETKLEASILDNSAEVPIEAKTAGKSGNLASGSKLTLVSSPSGVSSSAVVSSEGMNGGNDLETPFSLLERFIDRVQEPPHGGAGFDYVKWAKEVSGVTRAWPYPKELGEGTVTVRFMKDGSENDGIPNAADVAEVQEYIDNVRPVTANLTVVAPIPVALDLEISGLNPNEQAVKNAIEAELKDLLIREAKPACTILISHIREAISIAAGEHDHTLISPAENKVHTTGQIPVLGSIIWS